MVKDYHQTAMNWAQPSRKYRGRLKNRLAVENGLKERERGEFGRKKTCDGFAQLVMTTTMIMTVVMMTTMTVIIMMTTTIIVLLTTRIMIIIMMITTTMMMIVLVMFTLERRSML